MAISGSTALFGTSPSAYSGAANVLSFDVSSLLTVGLNTLYVNVTDLGGASGVMFGAKISTVDLRISNILSLLGLGFVLMFMFSWKRKLFIKM